MINIIDLRYSGKEQAGFSLERPKGHPAYTFLHFYNSVDLLVNGQIITTKPHACIVYNQFTPQYFHSESTLVHDWIHFGSGFNDHFALYELQYDTLYYPNDPDFITLIIREMQQEFYSLMPYKEEMLRIKTDELFLKFSRAISDTTMLPSSEDIIIQFTSLRTVMMYHLEREWTIQDMATEVGMSRSKFHVMYKTIFGISPINDLINMRISSAKTLLLHSNKSITEISEQTGYKNVQHFSKQFHNIVGKTPGQFRIDPSMDENTPPPVAITKIMSDALAYHHRIQEEYNEIRRIEHRIRTNS